MSLHRTSVAWPALGAALPDLAIATVFLVAWIAPGSFGTHVVPQLMLVMLLEFIIVHSSVFLGNVMIGNADRAGKAKGLVIITGFYTLFVGGFALAFRTWWPIASFWGLTLNRLMSVLLGQAPGGGEKQFLQRSWAASVMAYLCFAMVTTMLPVPRLGVTGAFREGIPGSGLWVSEPHRVIAFGFLYFTAVGISELFGHRWLKAGAAGVSRSPQQEGVS